MKKPDSWMPFYIGDYLKDTMALRREEHGSYLLLIMAYWARGGPLPSDDHTLQSICRCPDSEWCRTKGILSAYFIQEDGVWRHKRIDSELADAKREYEAQCDRTRAATEARLAKQKNVTTDVTTNDTKNVTTDVTFTQPQPQPQPQVQPESQRFACTAHVPSEDEVLKLADCRMIPRDSAKRFYDHHQNQNLWLNQFGRLIDWQRKLKTWAENDRATQPPKKKGAVWTDIRK